MPRDPVKKAPWSNPRLMREILDDARTVAIVGISDNPSRPSFGVARFLIEHGYHVIGVNPKIEDVLGTICYKTLADVPETIDVVDVFRNPETIIPLVNEVIKLKIPYLWLQEGVVNQEAAEIASEAGVKVVMDRCMAKEIARRE